MSSIYVECGSTRWRGPELSVGENELHKPKEKRERDHLAHWRRLAELSTPEKGSALARRTTEESRKIMELWTDIGRRERKNQTDPYQNDRELPERAFSSNASFGTIEAGGIQ
jgi:hypothetical protein